MGRIVALIAALCLALPAWSQTQQPIPCTPTTIGTSAAPIVFRANAPPTQYVHIVNPNASGSLWINAAGGTAAVAASGSEPMLAQGNSVTLPPIMGISIIGSTSNLAVTCFYN
jgi:hypothetical protein